MSGFTKLVPEIIQSSIWNEASDIRIVWITLIAIKDQDGYVRGDARTIARLANVPTEAAEIALKKFQEPDEYSHTPTDEGRRIRKADGGFTIINHGLYRSADRTEYMKTYMREYRERISAEDKGESDSVNNAVNNVNTNVNLPSVSVSASLSDSAKKVDTRGKGYEIPKELEEVDGFNEALTAWVEFRRAKKAPATDRVMKTVLKRLAERPLEAISAIDTCITAGWTDVRWDWVDNRNKAQGLPSSTRPSLQPRTDVDPALRTPGYGKAITPESLYGGDDE